MFESKLGTERETDITKIGGADHLRDVKPRVEEKIVQNRKKKEYLDNFQYQETIQESSKYKLLYLFNK